MRDIFQLGAQNGFQNDLPAAASCETYNAEGCVRDLNLWWITGLTRACHQLSQMIAAARWIAARKFLAVLS
jgi:hypothetical protein